jgi:hypothetical protein
MLNIYKTKAMRKYIKDDFVNPNFAKHNIANKHIVVSGPTGSGKSNLLGNFIMQFENTFDNIIVVCKTAGEPIYLMLKKQLGPAIRFCSLAELEPLEKLPKGPKQQQLIIFDDFLTDSQKKLKDYVMYGRKHLIMCMFLTQSFFATDLFIRNNVGYIILLKNGNKQNLDAIVNRLGLPVSNQTVAKVIKNATKEALNVCIIDLVTSYTNKKIRRNFNDYYELVDEDDEELPEIKLYKGSGLVN